MYRSDPAGGPDAKKREMNMFFARVVGCCVAVLLIAATANAAVADVADAAMRKNLPAVRSLLQQKADVNAPQSDGATALHWAVRADDLDMAELLIRAGANVKAANRLGVTPLSLACINGNAAMIEKLLKAGVDPNSVLSEAGETALMMASRTGNVLAVKVLIDHRADVNAKEKSRGQTALMWAASEGHPAVVKMLIDSGADVNASSKTENVAPRGLYDRPATPAAARPAPGSPEDTAFQKIESEPDVDVRLVLLVNFEKDFPKSTLLLEIYQAMSQIYQEKGDQPNLAIVREKLVPIERQMRQGPQRNAGTPSGGITPLMFAARENSLESARALVGAGADLNLAMANGSNALLLAILNGHYELASFLVEKGANPNVADSNGKAALYAAVEMRNLATTDTPGPQADKGEALELIRSLLNHGADPKARLTGRPPFRGGANRAWLSEPGATPFYRASASGDITVMRLLLAHGADPYVAANDNTTPLMVAAGIGFLHGSTYVWSEREALEALQLSLELGNLQAVNDAGLTALHGAAFRGWNAGVQTLVDKGANLDAKDKQGRTPLNWADGVYRGGGIAPVRQLHTIALFEQLMK
jgi:ankyrin repeat protein